MLSLLLDENISHEVAAQIRHGRPELLIESMHTWEGGRFLQAGDDAILAAAYDANRTLVTYDVRTIPTILAWLRERGVPHGGVIFVSSRSIPSRDFGVLIRAIVRLWDEENGAVWTDRVAFLRP